MPDNRTIAYYDRSAQAYDDLVRTDRISADLRAFLDLLPSGGAVLDLGCGPARASVWMRSEGFHPDPVDASQGMIDLANATHDIGARLLTFDQIDMVAAYDGVWANFSLLHAPRDSLPRHLAAVARALKPGGHLHIGMKTGTGSARDRIDRLYTYVTLPELRGLLGGAGFTILFEKEGEEMGSAGTIDPIVTMRARRNA